MTHRNYVFPDDFTWGVATASYQIEGAVAEGGRKPSIWDTFAHTPGKVANGDTGDVACDHYHRWREDLAIMKELGVKAYRLSIAWPRVLPDGDGEVNEEGVRFYSDLVDGLLEASIEPWVTLFHWDLPQVLDDRGGWQNRDMLLPAWDQYVETITSRLGDRVKHWITINEPWVVAYLGYAFGVMAPGRKDMKETLAVAHALNVAHGRAVEIVRKNVPDAKVGITLNMSYHYPETDDVADVQAAWYSDGAANRWFIDPVMRGEYPQDMWTAFGDAVPEIRDGDMDLASIETDFLGINSYNPAYIKADPDAPFGIGSWRKDLEYTAMDWPVDPEGFRDLIERVYRDYAPPAIVITENGSAWDDVVADDGAVHDDRRIAYLEGHLRMLYGAMATGAPVIGYFAWSLLDNFEWAEGYSKRFGIVRVDYDTQERTIKDSARRYAEIVAANGL